MKQLPLEPAHWDESNGSGLILLWPLDAEIIDKISNGTLPHADLLNISVSSGRRRMRPPPFDSSRWAGSNGNCFILLRSLDAELFHKMYFQHFDVLKLLYIMWFNFIDNKFKSCDSSASNFLIKTSWHWKAWNWKNWKIPIASNFFQHTLLH